MTAAPVVSLVVAMAHHGVIGRDNALPWHLRADLQRFKSLTLGKPVLMGRKTFESIGRPLPGRSNIVLTRDARWSAPGVTSAHTLAEALARAAGAAEVAVIGGAEVYRLALPSARRIFLTRVLAEVPGDTRFPELDEAEWREVGRSSHPADEHNDYPVTFVTLERRAAPPPY
ncbi:MAG: dihydrofolate reductase [Proteobacteria bacterium]|nr:dihydrofolate reductase [Pseudomonadota bacterium]